jgi:hypothetical protein
MDTQCVNFDPGRGAKKFTTGCGCDITWSLRASGWYRNGKGSWYCSECCDSYGGRYGKDYDEATFREFTCYRCAPHVFRQHAAQRPPQPAEEPDVAQQPPPGPPARRGPQTGPQRPQTPPIPPRAAPRAAPPPPGLAEPEPVEATGPAAGTQSTSSGAASSSTATQPLPVAEAAASSADAASTQLKNLCPRCQTETENGEEGEKKSQKIFESRTTSVSGEYFANLELEASFEHFEDKFGRFEERKQGK